MERNRALDYLRACSITAMVVGNHAARAYARLGEIDRENYLRSTAPIVDSQRWFGFDVFLALCTFAMPLVYLLSGVFVASRLVRLGGAAFLKERALRLGLPFAVAATVVIPFALYPSFLVTGADSGFLAYWSQSLRSARWPTGPAWFIWLLLAFNALCALGYVLLSKRLEGLSRVLSAMRRPAPFFLTLLALSGLTYLPMLAAFGPLRWIGFGPFSFQASRLPLYVVYFAAGVLIGALGVESTALARDGWLVARWRAWLLAAAASFAGMAFIQLARLSQWWRWPQRGWELAYGAIFVLYCCTGGFGLVGLFLRFTGRRSAALESLTRNSYAIYLIHYVFVLWLQFALLGVDLGAPLKAGIVFTVSLALAWAASASLRRIPALARIL